MWNWITLKKVDNNQGNAWLRKCAVYRLAVLVLYVAVVTVEVVTDADILEQLVIFPFSLLDKFIGQLKLIVYHHIAVKIHTPAHVEVVLADVARSKIYRLVAADLCLGHDSGS